MMANRNYHEYLISNVIMLSPNDLADMLKYEVYSGILVYRLLGLRDYFLENEVFEMLIPIRDFCDEHSINLDE